MSNAKFCHRGHARKQTKKGDWYCGVCIAERALARYNRLKKDPEFLKSRVVIARKSYLKKKEGRLAAAKEEV